MIENKFTVIDPAGLHARPVALLTKLASQYAGDVTLKHDGKNANMKSIINIMALGIKQNAEFSIAVSGQDEAEFMAQIVALIDEHKLTTPPEIVK